jgi:methylmalonyl-CoA/ethylmalonyl-CoA epimerase
MESWGILGEKLEAVDHLAIAVEDLEAAVTFYRDRLGFREAERRTTQGVKTAMDSVVMEGGPLKVVLLKGTSPESQVSRYVAEYGPGVQHVAFRVTDLEAVVADLRERGLAFDTEIIQGAGLKQAFSNRDSISGMMFEFVERAGEEGFQDQNVQKLFESLEQKGTF